MPVELIGYSEDSLKYLVTGIFSSFLLFLIFLWFFDFLSGSSGDG